MTATQTTSYMRGAANGPRSPNTIGVSCYSTFRERLHEDDDEVHAFGVDDVERFIPASV